jgi:integrase
MPKLSDTEVPSYRRHKQSGQAIVTLSKRDILLGQYGSRGSRDKYNRIIGEWLAAGRQLPSDPASITVAEVVNAFRKHADHYYRHADGSPTGEATTFAAALSPLTKLYARTAAAEFGPLKLKAVRDAMVRLGWARTSINKQVGRIKHVFKWAVENEMISAEVFHGLQAVAGFRAGRSDAPEPEPVRPVPVEYVEAVLPHVSPQVRAMIRLQLLTGMRSGEVCIMRSCDIDTTGKLWVYRPAHHKTQHHGHVREVYLGPKAQDVLRPFLKADLAAYVFDPRDAERHRRQNQHARRRTPLAYGNRPGTNLVTERRRQPGDHYTNESYRRAISRACDAADQFAKGGLMIGNDERAIPSWHPHQLRHTAATELRKTHGLEAAQVILGHRTLTVTQVYAEKNVEAAMKIMTAVG